MKQRSIQDILAEARAHSVGNRREIEASKSAECFSCCAPFLARDVADWRDEWIKPEHQNRVKRWSAICPRCGEATVIGSASGLLDDPAYIPIVKSLGDAE